MIKYDESDYIPDNCELCDEPMSTSDLMFENCKAEICDECLKKNATFENAICFGKERKSNVEINGFIAELLGEDKINEILFDFIKEHKMESDIEFAKDYCSSEEYDFAIWLKKEFL